MSDPDDDQLGYVRALMQAYPRLFWKETPLGVWFPPGWSVILNDLCAGIDRLLDNEQAKQFHVTQVKEKFGTLRFYYSAAGKAKVSADIHLPGRRQRIELEPKYPTSFPAQAIDALITEAERSSAVTCLQCGAPGVLRTGGWLRVTCDRCESNFRRRRSDLP